jgi:sugar lactone lactonase YvrE
MLTASYGGNGNFAASSTVIGPNSLITTVAGGGSGGSVASGPATAANLSGARSITTDAAGDIFIADLWNNAVYEVNHATGIITTVAGNGQLGDDGDNGPATAAKLGTRIAVAVDAAGDGLFIVESWENSVVREVNLSTGVITTVAGGGGQIQQPGDTEQATTVELGGAGGVAVDSTGNLFVADSADNVIREVNLSTGVMTVVAGSGTRGSTGDNGPTYAAELGDPVGVAVDGTGHLFITEYNNARIREVNLSTGVITTVAGNGIDGFSGENGQATAAQLWNPSAVAVDNAGNIFIADYGNNRIRKVNIATGIITTVAGNGSGGFAGDNGPATDAGLTFASSLAFDSAGDLFIADAADNRVREVNHATGIITTVAGGGSQGLGDGGQATAAELNDIGGIAVDNAGNLFIADSGDNRIREVDLASGIISTIAGTGYTGYMVDGISAYLADLTHPSDVATDSAGNLFIADVGDSRILTVALAMGMSPPWSLTRLPPLRARGPQATAARTFRPPPPD